MTKAFNKGDKVTLIGGWSSGDRDLDDKFSDISYFHMDATVFSCGKKQMILTDELGAELGRNFVPANAADMDDATCGKFQQLTFPRMSTEEAAAKALELAETQRADSLIKWDNLSTGEYGHAYHNHMKEMHDHHAATPARAIRRHSDYIWDK